MGKRCPRMFANRRADAEPFCICGQIFEGNTHYDTPELRHFEETVAQYIRLYPERWSPAGIGMRVEILGCDLPGRLFFPCFHDRDSFHI